MKRLINQLVLLLLTAASLSSQQNVIPQLKGPYPGQESPGMTPEMFAPGIISRPGYSEHSAALFTPDAKEVCWTAKANDQREYRIYSMKMVSGTWSRPGVAGFCREGKYYQECIPPPTGRALFNGREQLADCRKTGRFPSVSPDGKYLFTFNQWAPADFTGEMKPKG